MTRFRPISGEKTCEFCGGSFPVKARHARTCSPLCRQKLCRLNSKTRKKKAAWKAPKPVTLY